MRRLRWLLPVAILAIVVAVASYYLEGLRQFNANAPNLPEMLESALAGRANDWCYTQSELDRPRFKVCAERFEQVLEPDEFVKLENVSIELHHDSGDAYDLVRSQSATFREQDKTLISEGEVEITLGVPTDENGEYQRSGKLLKIYSSGVQFDTESGVAFTEQDVSFSFEKGSGSSVGAYFNPNDGDLKLLSEVKLDWQGSDPDSAPMHIEAGEGWYLESESKVLLYPWSHLERQADTGTLVLDAGVSDISLEEGVIRRAGIEAGRGRQIYPDREVEFAGDQLNLTFGENSTIQKMESIGSAELTSTSAETRNHVTSDRLDLDYVPAPAVGGESSGSVLSKALATGNSRVRLDPVATAGDVPDSRELISDVIRLAMRPGGEEIESVVTDGEGTLNLIPNRVGQPSRRLTGDRIWMDFGADNHLSRLRSIDAETLTETPGEPASTSTSDELVAVFDPQSGEIVRLEQTGNFHYEEAEQTAQSDRAVLEQLTGFITLTGKARAGSPTGSLAADRIVLSQSTGDYTAEGNVTTTRRPSVESDPGAPKPDGGAPLIASGELLQATAQRMVTSGGNQHVVFEGNAKTWQGSNRVEGARIEIDQTANTLAASGDVMTQFVDSAPPASQAARVFTIVHAPEFDYDEQTRLAHYRGGVRMERPGLTVESQQLRAFLNEAGSSSTLDRAVAEGDVVITGQEQGQAPRTATTQHAEYFVDDQLVHLTGPGSHIVIPSRKLDTVGKQVIWSMAEDRVEVTPDDNAPVRTRIGSK